MSMSGFYVTVTTMAMVTVGVWVGVRGAYNEPDWGFQSYLDRPFTLPCNHSSLGIKDGDFVVWELPNGEMLEESKGEKYDLSPLNHPVANMYLTIRDVKANDNGVYLCHVFTNRNKQEKRGWLLRGLNLGGHKYDDRFEEYRDNLMVGGLAAVVLFVPLVTACFIYKFRFQTKEQRVRKHAARHDATRHQRHLAANGKGAELSDIAVVSDGRGEINQGYDNAPAFVDIRL